MRGTTHVEAQTRRTILESTLFVPSLNSQYLLTMLSLTPNHLLPSEFDQMKIESLISWMKTFPQFDGLIDESIDSIQLLSLVPVAR